MNFKPTLWKSLVSLIGGLIVDLWVNTYTLCLTTVGPAVGEGKCPTTFEAIFSVSGIIIVLIIAIIIYIIWSLFQKK